MLRICQLRRLIDAQACREAVAIGFWPLFVVGALSSAGIALVGDSEVFSEEAKSKTVFVLRYPPEVDLLTRDTDDLLYAADRRCSDKDERGKRSATIRVFLSDKHDKYKFELEYPSVREGDIVPLFGVFCRVGEVKSDQRDPGSPKFSDEPDVDNERLRMTRVSEEESTGWAPPSNCLAIPLNGSSKRYQNPEHYYDDKRVQRYGCHVEKIAVSDKGKTC